MPPKYKSTHKRTRGSKGQFNKVPTPTSSSSNSSEESNDTGFISDSKDDENLWEVEKIVDERKGQYKVKWAGINPDTGKAWDLDWVNKRDCTDGLVEEWKWRKTREAEIGSGRGRGKGRGGGRGGKGKGVSRGDGRGVSGERKSGEVGTSAAGVSFSRSESGGKSMSVEKDKGKGKEKENVVVRNDNRWGSVGKRKVTEVGMMQGTAKGNGKGKEREVVEPEESSTEEGSEDEDNEIERNITTKKQYIEKLKEEEEESEGSQAGSALDDNTAVRRRETPENPPYDSEQETGSHSPEVRSPSPQVSKLPLRIGPPRGVKRKVEIDAERPRAKKAKTTQQILTPATSSCNVAIGKIGPPRRAMAHTDSGSSKAASSTSKLVEKSKLKEIVPSSVLSVHVPFREPSPIVSQTQVREECNDDVSMFWEDPILHHLQNSAEIGIPETQFPETQYSHHEVPTFEEGHFDSNASPYEPSRPLPTLSPPTLPQNLEDTNKVPSSQTVSSVVAKMKPSPKKPKPVTKLNLMREITPPPSPDGIDPHRRPSPGPSRRSLKPIPMMPLALFEPYLRAQGPSQETIEEFSSPKRETRRPTMHKRLVADIMDSIVEETVSQPMPEANISSQEQIQMQEMEDEYLNLEPPVSPSQPEVPASLPVTIARSPAPSPPTQNTQDIELHPDTSNFPLPPTASTQQAVIDSQSQIEMISSPPSLNHSHPPPIPPHDESSNGIQLLAEKESRIQELETQLREAIKQRSIAQNLYASAEAEVEAMQATIRDFKNQGTTPFFELLQPSIRNHSFKRMKQLEEDNRRLDGLNRILMLQNARTNDGVRKKAACEPELQETILKQRSKLEILEETLHELQRRNTELKNENEGLGQCLERAEYALDKLAAANAEESVDSGGSIGSDMPPFPLSTSSSDQDDGEVEDFVCQYMIGGTQWCLARFPSSEGVIRHALDVHYNFGDIYDRV